MIDIFRTLRPTLVVAAVAMSAAIWLPRDTSAQDNSAARENQAATQGGDGPERGSSPEIPVTDEPADAAEPPRADGQANANSETTSGAQQGTSAAPIDRTELAEQAGGFRSARRTLVTFHRAMGDRDYKTAVSAMDFSQYDPPPDSFTQVRLAQRLLACMDRLAIVDEAIISDEVDGPPAPFPPGKEDSSIILARAADGRWQFTPDTVARIDAVYEVLKGQDPITEQKEVGPAEPAVADSKEGEAEEPVPDASDVEPASSEVSVPNGLQSARQTMRTLFDALEERRYADAVASMDFSELEKKNPDMSPYAELAYARRLKEVLERMAKIDYAEISDDPLAPPFKFPIDELNQPIEISRQEDGRWQFSAATVSRIDALEKIYKNKPILNLAEEDKPWYERELILGNETWRILGLFGAVFLSLAAGQFIKSLMLWRSRTLEKREKLLRATVLKTVASTAVGLLFLLGLSLGLSGLVLEHSVSELVRTTIHVVFAVVIGYICFRLVDVVVEIINEFSTRSGSTLNNMLAPIISMSLRLTIIILVLLEIATAISDQPPSAVIAGLGAGGLAVGLAAQETIKNLFGSVMIFADHPFEIGDRIVVDGHDGPVESVGFRSTRLRTLDGHLVTVPNGELANRTICNIGKRPYIRRVMKIRLAYDLAPEQIERAAAIVRGLLENHQGMQEDRPARVFIDDFDDSAVNLKAYYWYHPAEFWDYCDFGAELNLQILQRFRDEGIRFALPSQRLFVSGDLSPPDNEQP